MKTTILGTANPCPQLERAGTGIVIEVNGTTYLIDCGPWVTYRMVEHDIDFSEIEDVFFTHHHMDHNVSFFHFALVSWYFGRRNLTVYGPAGTHDLIEGFETAYEKHIADVTQWRHAPPDGLTDIEIQKVSPEFHLEADDLEVTAMSVEHAYELETLAYRFEDPSTGNSIVFSGDTNPLSRMSEFAASADVLIHECNLLGDTETPLEDANPDSPYMKPPFKSYLEWAYGDATLDELDESLHTNATDAGAIAEKAGVETLVLTHFNALRDPEKIRADAKAEFSGEVIVAEDGLSVTL